MSPSVTILSSDATSVAGSQNHDFKEIRTPVKNSIQQYLDTPEFLTPIVVSPSESCTSSDDEQRIYDVFDDPIPSSPNYLTSQAKGKNDKSTPFTPITPLTPPLFKFEPLRDAKSPLSRKLCPGIDDEHVQHGGQRVGIEEDKDFKPQKLFKQMTDKLNAIKESSKTLGPCPLSMKIDFSPPQNRRPVLLRRSGHVNQENDWTTPPHKSVVDPPVDKSHRCFQSSNRARSTSREKRKTTTKFGSDLEHIVPLMIHHRLASNSALCVATLVGNPTSECHNKRKGEGHGWKTILSNIAEGHQSGDAVALGPLLEKLIECTMCGRHQKSSKSAKRLGDLKDWISNRSQKPKEREDFETWITSITSQEGHNSATNEEASKPTPTMGADTQFYNFKMLRPYQSMALKKLSISQALREELEKPLTVRGQQPGYIYIFWSKGQFGYVKIGRTDNPDRRLKEWNSKCNRQHEYHASCDGLWVPHVARVERLMHVELKDKRRAMTCDVCVNKKGNPVEHNEWFEMRSEEAIPIFQKWRAWIEQQPYAPVAGSDEWGLRPRFRKTLEEVCQPTQSTGSATRPAPQSRKGSNRRYNLRKTAARKTL